MEIILYAQYFSIKFVYVFERNIFHFDANALNLISIRKKKKKKEKEEKEKNEGGEAKTEKRGEY